MNPPGNSQPTACRSGGRSSDHVRPGGAAVGAGSVEWRCTGARLRHGRLAECRHCRRSLHLHRRPRAHVSHRSRTRRRRNRLFRLVEVLQVCNMSSPTNPRALILALTECVNPNLPLLHPSTTPKPALPSRRSSPGP